MPDDLKKSQLRAIQYFFVDGSFEFGFGLMVRRNYLRNSPFPKEETK